MKKILQAVIFPALLITAVSVTAFTHQEKKNAKKEQQAGKQDKPDKQARGQGKNKDQGNQGQGNQGQGNQGQGRSDDKGPKDAKPGKDNRGQDAVDARDDNAGKGKGKGRNADDGYVWDRETFKDRKNIRNQEKVTICHKVDRDGDPGVTIRVSTNALKAHTAHGDVTGECPNVADKRFSDRFLRTRTDYYNVLQNGQEQVLYSQSILDYALLRLADARLQLQNPGLSPADLQRRQLLVVELDRDMSLLRSLVGVVSTLVANKLLN